MNTLPIVRRRRIWPWIVAGCLLLWVALAAFAWSVITPARELSVLREGFAGAAEKHWQTQVQFDLGPASLGLARTILKFVQHDEIDKAKAALSAVRRASVCVYSRSGTTSRDAQLKSVAAAEAELASRGWQKMVKVTDADNIVLVLHGEKIGKTGEFCVAVLEDDQCVLVYAKLAADDLSDLVSLARESMPELKRL